MATDAIIAIKKGHQYCYSYLPAVGDPTCIGAYLLREVNTFVKALCFVQECDVENTCKLSDVLKAAWDAAAGHTYLFEDGQWWLIQYDGDYDGQRGELHEQGRASLSESIQEYQAWAA